YLPEGAADLLRIGVLTRGRTICPALPRVQFPNSGGSSISSSGLTPLPSLRLNPTCLHTASGWEERAHACHQSFGHRNRRRYRIWTFDAGGFLRCFLFSRTPENTSCWTRQTPATTHTCHPHSALGARMDDVLGGLPK